MNIKIIVAAHKDFRVPTDEMYLPLQVGAAINPPLAFQGDNTGENISQKNANYCELTGVYWAWKNLQADYIGLVHYRRHFRSVHGTDKWKSIMTEAQAEKLCEKNEIILPKKRRYFIETNYSHYIHAHEKEGLLLAEKIIKRDYPKLSAAYDKLMKRTSAHMFNMFIMRYDRFCEYCGFLFDVLGKVEGELDISSYSQSEARVFGYIGELMLDVWLEGNGYSYKETGRMFMGNQNWLVKGGNFVRRKFSGRK